MHVFADPNPPALAKRASFCLFTNANRVSRFMFVSINEPGAEATHVQIRASQTEKWMLLPTMLTKWRHDQPQVDMECVSPWCKRLNIRVTYLLGVSSIVAATI